MYSPQLSADPLRWTLDFLLLMLIAAIWCLPSLLNQFPLSYYDTAYYLYNARNLDHPTLIGWRPITYSVFLFPGLKILNMMLFIFYQNLAMAAGLFYFHKTMEIELPRPLFLLGALLLFLTPFVYTSNFIMPDIFSGLTLLFLASFIYGRQDMKRYSLVLALICSFMHYSNFLFLVPTLLILHPIFRKKEIWLSTLVLILLIFARLAFFYPQKNFEQTTHLLLYSRLAHYQISHQYYEDNCPKVETDEEIYGAAKKALEEQGLNNIFCRDRSITFNLWGQSKSDKTGESLAMSELLPSIVDTNQKIILSSYFFSYLLQSFKQTAFQLIDFYRPIDFILEDRTLVHYFTVYGFKDKFENQKIFNNKIWDRDYLLSIMSLFFFVLTSLCFFGVLLMVLKEALTAPLASTLKVFLVGYLFNSLGVGFFSEPEGRYSTRLTWVIVWICLTGFHLYRKQSQVSRVVIKK